MEIKDKLKIATNILNNAADLNLSYEILLKISQKIDSYLVEYYREIKKEQNIKNSFK